VKDHLLALAAGQRDLQARLNLVREYLQAHILRSVHSAGAFAALAFQGGTALRFLYGLRRFSEDLDFALERPEHDRGLEYWARTVKRDLELAGHDVEATLRTARTVQSASVKFPGLLREVGLARQRSANLMIRMEVDARPPAGAVLETRLITRHFPMTFRVHDLSSCMAGKIHALLARRYAKGRDLFDLAWYLTRPDHPSPNFELLANALAQTEWKGPRVGPETWRDVLLDRVSSLGWSAVIADVEPFLEDPGDRQLLDREALLSELTRAGS
jgi:predicted nucleotidyltransferase component of viral defense system